MVEQLEVLWDVDVRVGGIVVERESFLPSVPGEDEGMGTMWGSAIDLAAMPLVDSTGGAGWAVGQLRVADFAVGMQTGHDGVEGGDQDNGRGPRTISVRGRQEYDRSRAWQRWRSASSVVMEGCRCRV